MQEIGPRYKQLGRVMLIVSCGFTGKYLAHKCRGYAR